ncbi:MAG: hypothetical protein HKN24_11420 [Acidimicrobiales bacterium]|nr:hypothetical protein [Acidimicrobiales bacterium]
MEPNRFESFDAIQEDASSLYRLALGWAKKVVRIASGMFWATAITGVTALVFGLIVLNGGWRLVWLVFGGGAVLFGVGTSYRLRSGVNAIIENASGLQGSIAGLLGEVTDSAEAHELATSEDDGLVRRARKARNFRKIVKGSLDRYKDVANALSVIGTFPAVVASSIAFTVLFGVLAVIFGIALLF